MNAKNTPYEIDPDYIEGLVAEVESVSEKSPKVSVEIVRVLEEAKGKYDKAFLNWNLVEAFVDDLCQDPDTRKDKNTFCRENVRALFENRENPI